jgi:hypothetical protein
MANKFASICRILTPLASEAPLCTIGDRFEHPQCMLSLNVDGMQNARDHSREEEQNNPWTKIDRRTGLRDDEVAGKDGG